jgi:hypothetical protein
MPLSHKNIPSWKEDSCSAIMAAIAEDKEPLSFRSAVLLLCNEKKAKQVFADYVKELNDSFLEFVTREVGHLPEFQENLGCTLVLVQKRSKKYCRWLLFDGRFVTTTKQSNINCFLFDENGCLKEISSDLPRLTHHNYRCVKQEPLYQLLNLEKEEHDPRNLEEVVNFLKLRGLQDSVDISLCISLKPRIHRTNWYCSYKQTIQFRIEAFTTANYQLGFRRQVVSRHRHKTTPEQEVEVEEAEEEQLPDPLETNNSAAVSVLLSGKTFLLLFPESLTIFGDLVSIL